VYQATSKTFLWTARNSGAALNLTGYTPFMYWAQSNSASAIVTASCAIVSATGGTFTATFTPSDLNTNGTCMYGVGVVSGSVSVAAHGTFTIVRDPYATGASNVTFTVSESDDLQSVVNRGASLSTTIASTASTPITWGGTNTFFARTGTISGTNSLYWTVSGTNYHLRIQ
jgi:hypothetical protein